MFHRPDKVLQELTDATKDFPCSVVLHGLLYRLCEAHAGTLDDCLREEPWQEHAVRIDHRIQRLRTSYPRSWLAEIREELASLKTGETESIVVGCSAILQVLDAHHRSLRTQLESETLALPVRFGGGRMVLLPPPENAIAEAVPRQKRLTRDRSHLKHEVRKILGLWWHLVHPDRFAGMPEFRPLDAWVSDRLRSRWESGGDLSIALAAPFAHLDFDFHADPDRCHDQKGVPYRFVGLKPKHLKEARAIVDRLLASCAEHRVDMLCFPELTLDNDLLGHLQSRLKSGDSSRQPALVVAGSFHLTSDLRWWNRCHVLDGRGRLLFTQDKCKPFEIPADQARKMPELCKKLGIDDRGGFEEVKPSTTVVIADFSLGRLATPICLDFCGKELRELLIESRTNLLLVPAMTPRLQVDGPPGDGKRTRPGPEHFVESAQDFGTDCRGSVFVVNSAWLLRQIGALDDTNLYLGYVPSKGGFGQGVKISEDLTVFSVRVLLEGA